MFNRHVGWGRTAARNRRRGIRIESLEARLLLAVDAATEQWSGNGWVVDANATDVSSFLVRFVSDEEKQLPVGLEQGRGFSIVSGLQELSLSPGVDPSQMLAALRANPAVAYAEPNYKVRAAALPDDPQFNDLWGFNNTGQTGGTPDADIDLPEAWEFSVGSGDSIVAVIDTGVDYNHIDLQANMWRNLDEVPSDGVDNDGNGYIDDYFGYDFANDDPDPFDDNRHGTHVAGTIAAVGNNGTGVAGVNWNAQIMALKFLDASGQGSVADAIEAIEYAVANGATISNNSWGFNGGDGSTALLEAIAQAQSADHLFVAAAGNGNFFGIGQDNDINPFFPASYELDNILAVAASDHNDSRAIFSNYGVESVDVAAPGVNIVSTTPGNAYQAFQGTSMATPHVAGLAALIRDLQPTWTYQQTINQILNTVDVVPAFADITVSGGRINAAAALQSVANPAPEISVSTPGGLQIQDDTGQLELPNTPPELPFVQTIVVKNVGTLPLELTEPIAVPATYSVASSFESTIVQPGETTSFAIQLEAATEGTYSGEVSFGTNDPDENPFNFTVTGTVATPPPILILDNGDSAFTSTGEWTLWDGQGYQDDVHESLAGSGQDVARWTFWGMLPGTYSVSATWTTYSNRATNSPFTIWDDDTPLDTVLVNQQLLPDDYSDAGADWEQLGGLVTIDGGALVVSLSDDANGRVNADAIRIERVPDEPEIEVSQGGVVLEDGVSDFNFGTAVEGAPLQKTFTVDNLGVQPLTLDPAISLPAGFGLVSGFAQTTLQPGESTTFVVQLNAEAVGSYSGELSFGNNDTDENPFDLTVSGTVDPPPPPIQFIDNGDAGFSTTGSWNRWTGQGYQNDIHESLPGSGDDVARWTFPTLPGVYSVSATWSTHSNRATDSPFTVWDGDTPLDTVLVNQQLSPDDFSDVGADWEQLSGLLSISSGTLVVTLSDDADGRLNADAIRIERVANEPEIDVSQGGVVLEDGVSNFSFGTAVEGAPLQKTFTVDNLGVQPLTLNPAISLPAGFSLVSGFAQTTLQPGESTTFVVQLDAETIGSYSGQISFGNNDADEDPFDFVVSGTVDVPPPPIQIIDNGDAGFSLIGSWNRWTGQGYQNDIHESYAGSGDDVARWTFPVLPGIYSVSATWSTYPNRATNAPFTIWDGDTPLDTVLVNQKLSPDDFSDAGADWEQLGGLLTIDGGALVVSLNDDADGRLNADAIRIERVANEPEIEVSQGGVVLEDGVSNFSFGTAVEGAPLQKTFTVDNLGVQPLTLDPISLPAGFSLVSGFAQTTLQPTESTTFVVQLDAETIGSYSGQISFGNNDADEDPFDFTISGTVDAPPPSIQIIDNGDAGFSTTGTWKRWTGQGFENDIHESYAGSGDDLAHWTFPVLPGTYTVSATWTTHPNRATNAPFTIWDGDTSLDTVLVNQELPPDDFSDAGADWEQLGGVFTINAGALVVTLSDDADGRLNADAVRIEQVTQATASGAAVTPSSLISFDSEPKSNVGDSATADESEGGMNPTSGNTEGAFFSLSAEAAPRASRGNNVDRVLSRRGVGILDESLLELLASERQSILDALPLKRMRGWQ